MNEYYELEIAFNKFNYETIYNTLYLNDVTTIIEENGILKISLPEKKLAVLKFIKKTLIENKIANENNVNLIKFKNLDWNKKWKKSIEPVFIKDKIIIYPSWKKDFIKNTVNRILIEIGPKMSFGTGQNETTQLILELMCDHITSHDISMLDYGCGTGILSIAGIKLGLKQAVAIDIDDDAVENAKEYFKVNNAGKKIKLYKSDINDIDEKNFDVICANITSGVIIKNIKHIKNRLRQDGKLFITGILTDEKEDVERTLMKNNFKIKEIREKGEWTGYYTLSNQ